MCLSCEAAVETSDHVLEECTTYDEIRLRAAKQLIATGLGAVVKRFSIGRILRSEPEVEHFVKTKTERQKENFYAIIKSCLWAIHKVRKHKAIQGDNAAIR